jgi:uncharacterized membrane protein YdbT with pleckstrin-like domain
MHALPFLAVALLAALACGGLLIGSQPGGSDVAAVGGLLLLLLAFELLMFLLLRRLTTECLLTRDRLVLRDGLLAPRVSSWPLDQLERVDVEQSFVGRTLHFGALVISPRGARPIRLNFVAAPRVIGRHLEEKKQNVAVPVELTGQVAIAR